MKIVIACDSYKGCLSSEEVSNTMEKAIHQVDPDIHVDKFLTGDGGEGTMQAFVKTCGGYYVEVKCKDTYGRIIKTRYALIDKGETAIVEVASILGLNMYQREKRVPFYSSSYGVGQVLSAVLQRGCKKIILSLGGSGNADGGMGLLEALGMEFYDIHNRKLKGMTLNLEKIARINPEHLLDFSKVECIAAYDVKNYLLGEEGATFLYGKQKGLFPNQIKRVEKGMINYCEKMKEIGYDLDSYESGGACGGISAVSQAVLKAKSINGLDLLFSFNKIEDYIKDCDLVITGEGQSDNQTIYGKVPAGVVAVANKYQKPCICISGALGLKYRELYELGFIGIYSVADRAMTFHQAIEGARDKLEAATYGIMKTIMYFKTKEDL